MATQDEKRIGQEILNTARRLNLPVKLDEITEGRGNCFPLAVLAQCRRSEIFKHLNEPTKTLIFKNDPTLLRSAVCSFITNTQNEKIQDYKKRYQEVLAPLDNRSWTEYWKVMTRNYEWVDYTFVQSTAWFLGLDIIIVTTTSSEKHPYITISGNLTDENISCPGTEILIGSKSQVHYQSLLPLTVKAKDFYIEAGVPEDTIKLKVQQIASIPTDSNSSLNRLKSPRKCKDHQKSKSQEKDYGKCLKTDIQNCPEINSLVEFPPMKSKEVSPQNKSRDNISGQAKQNAASKVSKNSNPEVASKAKEYSIKSQEQNEKSHFIFKNEAETLDFEFESDKRVKCPRCKIAYKNIVCHLQKSRCKISNIKLLTERFQEFKKNMFAEDIRQKQNEWKKKSLAKKREENSQKLKDDLNKRESKYLAKQREEDPEKFKADQNQRKAKSRNKKREEDFQKVKQEQNKWKGKSLNKKREEDFQKVKEDQNKRKEKSLIKKREEDFQKVKDDQNERKRISLNKKREEDFQKVKDDQNKRKKLS